MKTTLCAALAALLVANPTLRAATHLVSQSSPNPTPPYDSWETAATNIQSAVDAASAGAFVLVSNGVYAGGLTIDKPLMVRSFVNAQFTIINGYGTNRCVSLADGVRLDGFTLTNGSAQTGAGVWCSSTNAYVTNCVIARNTALAQGGGAWSGTLGRCTILGNTAGTDGGGVASAVLLSCHVISNACSGNGGGTFLATANNCLLAGNSAATGGGAFGGVLNDCTLGRNDAASAGGARSAALNNSIVYLNTAPNAANVSDCTLNYCCTVPLPGTGLGNISLDPRFVDASSGNFHLQAESPCINAGNNALVVDAGLDLDRNQRILGGTVDLGAYEFQPGAFPLITLQPQTQTVLSGTDVQLIVAGQGSPPLSWQWRFNGNLLPGATDTRLSLPAVTTSQTGSYDVTLANSYGRTTSHVATLTVGDVAPWITTQPESHVIASGSFLTLTVGAAGSLPLSWQWYFNQGPIPNATNSSLDLGPITAADIGAYSVVVTNRFGSITSAEAILTLGVTASAYIWTNSPNPTPPYTNWATAAHTIQEAANAAGPGYQLVVTNGVYSGSLNIGKSLRLISVNGPQSTVIDGAYAMVPCVSLTDGCSLSGFTLTHGYGYYGGGAWCSSTNVMITNCVMLNNWAMQSGGGVYSGTLYDCTLIGNNATNSSGGAAYSILVNCLVASNLNGGASSSTLYGCRIIGNNQYGGGAVNSTLYNCLLTANGTDWFGGAAFCTLYNCTLSGNHYGAKYSTLYNSVIFDNPNPLGSNYDQSCTLSFCCTTPMPPAGPGNITNAPLFLNAAAGDFHLQPDSPCINAGRNEWVTTPADLDGNTRIVGGSVDLGAYEFPSPTSTISYAWLQRYGFSTDGSADFTDPDADSMNNSQEWVCGTIPTNSLSVLRMLSATPAGNKVTVTWDSVAGIQYFLDRSTDVGAWFSTGTTNTGDTNVLRLATGIPGSAGTTSFIDTNAAQAPAVNYRVGVRGP